MSELVISVLVGVVTLYVAFKVLKFALKMAFGIALVVAAAAAYFTYLAT